jgi:hypothetical protein
MIGKTTTAKLRLFRSATMIVKRLVPQEGFEPPSQETELVILRRINAGPAAGLGGGASE